MDRQAQLSWHTQDEKRLVLVITIFESHECEGRLVRIGSAREGKTMGKMRLFVALVCFLVTPSSFASAVGYHQCFEENSNELTDFEVCEAVVERQGRRNERKSPNTSFVVQLQELQSIPSRVDARNRRFKAAPERANHNGFGGCMLT